jgi:hypothetical protein
MGTKQANFRLSVQAEKLLKDIASVRGVNKTDVVEYCVARYAAELGVDIEGAKALLLQNLAKSIATSQPKKKP